MDSKRVSSVHEAIGPRRVLIVDDNVDSADVIAHVLELQGYETRVAYEPFSALAMATEFQPHVAILDVNLPTLAGFELGAAVSADLPMCRLIAITGDATALNSLRSQWAGFHGFLTKPIGLPELLGAVAETRPSGLFQRNEKRDSTFRGLTNRPPRERARIFLDESPEVVRYWTIELGCTEPQLRSAVAAVGINSEDVRRYLGK